MTLPDNVSYLPIWKEGATAEERFSELAMVARKHPERFGKVTTVYAETLPNGHTVLRQVSAGVTMIEMLGLYALASHDLLVNSWED